MLQTIISVTTETEAQYIFEIVGNVIRCTRYEGTTPSFSVATQRPIGHLKNMPLDCLPNIAVGRQMLIRRLGQQVPIVTSKVTDVTAISSFIDY